MRINLRNDQFFLAAILVFGTALWRYFASPVSLWDDSLLTNPNLTRLVGSPLEFFNQNSPHFKSWPLNASLIWTVDRIGELIRTQFSITWNNLVLFRTLTVVFHFGSSLLIYRFYNERKSALAFIFFFLHPMAYLTLSWSFQAITAASVFFAILGARTLLNVRDSLENEAANLFVGTLAITVSILLKPSSALYLIFFVFHLALVLAKFRLPSKLQRTYGTMVLISTLAIGVFANRAMDLAMTIPAAYPNEVPAVIEYWTDHAPPTTPFVNDLQLLSKLKAEIDFRPRQILYSVVSFQRYLEMGLGFSRSEVIQEKPTTTNSSNTLFGIVLAILLVTLFVFFFTIILSGFRKLDLNQRTQRFGIALTMMFIGWLPVSGAVYIPHFKISFTSPHYFYHMLPGFALLVAEAESLLKSLIDQSTKRRYKVLMGVLATWLLLLAVHHFVLYADFNSGSQNTKINAKFPMTPN